LGQYVSATVTKPPSDLQIVGVVKDSISENLRASPRPTVYVSYFQRASGTDSLEIRAAGSISQIAAAVHKGLQPSFPKTPIDVRPLTAQVEQTLVEERLMAKLAGGFGALGLTLACVGLYTVCWRTAWCVAPKRLACAWRWVRNAARWYGLWPGARSRW
jgi:hypothetical protein